MHIVASEDFQRNAIFSVDMLEIRLRIPNYPAPVANGSAAAWVNFTYVPDFVGDLAEAAGQRQASRPPRSTDHPRRDPQRISLLVQ